MAKNTNPLTKNLLIKQNWKTISLPITNRVKYGCNEFYKDKFLKDLINGSFFKLGILTSEISITKVCTGEITIQMLYYPLVSKELTVSLNKKENSKITNETIINSTKLKNVVLVPNLIKILKEILKLREPTINYKFVCVKAANKFVDSKILNDYINNMVIEDPSKLKNVVNSLIREYRTLNIQKNDTIIN